MAKLRQVRLEKLKQPSPSPNEGAPTQEKTKNEGLPQQQQENQITETTTTNDTTTQQTDQQQEPTEENK
jgi:hypothetical protein